MRRKHVQMSEMAVQTSPGLKQNRWQEYDLTIDSEAEIDSNGGSVELHEDFSATEVEQAICHIA